MYKPLICKDKRRHALANAAALLSVAVTQRPEADTGSFIRCKQLPVGVSQSRILGN